MAALKNKTRIRRNPVTVFLSILALILSLLFAYNLATAIQECRPYEYKPHQVSYFEDYFSEARYGSMAKYANENLFRTGAPEADPSHIYAFTKSLDYRLLSIAYSAGPGKDEKKSREYLDLYSAEAATIDRYRYNRALEQVEDYLTR